MPTEREAAPLSALRAIADTSRYDAPTADRDVDAECALSAMRVLPLAERVALVVWLLDV